MGRIILARCGVQNLEFKFYSFPFLLDVRNADDSVPRRRICAVRSASALRRWQLCWLQPFRSWR